MQTLDQPVSFQCTSSRCIRYSTKVDLFIVLEEHVLGSESDSGYFQLDIMTFRARGLSVILGVSGICVRNDSELANASLSAYLVSLSRGKAARVW